MTKSTTKTKGRALTPDPNRSLFKFKISFQPDADGSQKKQTWYSYDYPIEREMFPEGLGKDIRAQWKSMMNLCWKHEELYEYMKWLRPHVNQHENLELYIPYWPELREMTPTIETKFGYDLIQDYAHTCGFGELSFKPVAQNFARQPGNSPGRINFRDFYGFKYLHRNDYIVTNLAQGKILKVDIYDNLMYHSENHLHTLHGRTESIVTAPEPLRVRGGMPQAISTFLPKP